MFFSNRALALALVLAVSASVGHASSVAVSTYCGNSQIDNGEQCGAFVVLAQHAHHQNEPLCVCVCVCVCVCGIRVCTHLCYCFSACVGM